MTRHERGFHVVKHGSAWAIRRSGSSRVTTMGLTHEEAWAQAKELAQHVGANAYRHGSNGLIKERWPNES